MTMPLMRYVLLLCVMLMPACAGQIERGDCMVTTVSKHAGADRARECVISAGGAFMAGRE